MFKRFIFVVILLLILVAVAGLIGQSITGTWDVREWFKPVEDAISDFSGAVGVSCASDDARAASDTTVLYSNSKNFVTGDFLFAKTWLSSEHDGFKYKLRFLVRYDTLAANVTGGLSLDSAPSIDAYDPNSTLECSAFFSSSGALSSPVFEFSIPCLYADSGEAEVTLSNFPYYVEVGASEFYLIEIELTEESLTFYCGVDKTNSKVDSFASFYRTSDYYTRYYNFLQSDYVRVHSLSMTSGVIRASESIELYDYPNPVPLPPDPVKEGHTFAGWFYGDENAVNHLNCERYDGAPIYEDTALHAHFDINEYTVSFDAAGGENQSGQGVWSSRVIWNSVLNFAAGVEPSRAGYNFLGWFLSDGTQYTNQPIKSNIALIAHWEVKMYTVNFYVENDLFKTVQVEHGTRLLQVADKAQVYAANIITYKYNTPVDSSDAKAALVVADMEVYACAASNTDKVVDTVKNNKWLIVGGVAGGVILLLLIAFIASGARRK